jgi:hypothetical protein
MARTAQRIAIILAITASIIGYLYHAPHSEGIAQLNRIRPLSAAMKIAKCIVYNILCIYFIISISFAEYSSRIIWFV